MTTVSLKDNQFGNAFKLLFFITLIGLTFVACEDDESGTTAKPPSTSSNKIMPLGASRVEGDRPEFESFRYELWKLLLDGEWDFDYIGTKTDEAEYPERADTEFDPDHEGRGGWTSGQILAGLDEWLENAGKPDIVLFSSPGGNDALTGSDYNQTVQNINAVIDLLQEANPDITILIERLAPGRSNWMTEEQTNFFEKLQQEVVDIADEQSNSTSKIYAIDMFTGFSDDLLADDVHYNEAGARFIAERYYDVLQGILQE